MPRSWTLAEPLAWQGVQRINADQEEEVMRSSLAIVSAMCWYTSAAWGAPNSIEIGVLTCTIGHVVDAAAPDQKSAANEAREMVCSFTAPRAPEETDGGRVQDNGGTGGVPENRGLLCGGGRTGGRMD